jgi:hypothetical protein
MKYKFIFTGKPDKKFPFLKIGKVYDLEVKEYGDVPVIIDPFICPYSSWKTFFKNWKIKN